MKREDIKHAEEITNDEIYDNMINTFVERIQEKTNDLVKRYDRDHNRQIKSEMNGFDFVVSHHTERLQIFTNLFMKVFDTIKT